VTEDGRSLGPATLLRKLTGVDEDLLSTIRTERPRYTAMGGVVLGTALMAMFSLTVALLSVFDGFHVSILLFVPIWGAFILSLDRWLMANSSAPRAGARLRKLLPRLLLSIIFGVVIAEPLLLGVFHTAVVQQVRVSRNEAAGQLEADLKACNPLPGKPPAAPAADASRHTPDCSDKKITVSTQVPAIQAQIDRTNANMKSLKTTTDAEDAELARREKTANQECGGVKTTETTGRVGQGPNCRRDRKKANQYRADSQIEKHHDTLTADQIQLDSLTKKLSQAQEAEGKAIDQEITERVGKFTDAQRDIGLLERFAALGTLVDADAHMHKAQWALRLFFITVDALPVLLKFFSGYTPYDQVATERVAAQRRVQRVVGETERRRGVIQEQLARIQMNAEHASAIGKVEFDARIRNVDVEVLREDLTDARAAYLLGESATMPLPVAPRRDRNHHDQDEEPRP